MIPEVLPTAFEAFGHFDQWVMWEIQERGGKSVKVPIGISGHPVNAQEPASRGSFVQIAACARALEASKGSPVGVGFVFTAADPFFFIDVDNAINDTGEVSPVGAWVREQFPNAAFEVSQSGRGFHLFGQYTEAIAHANKNATLGLELYIDGRFCAMTFEQPSGAIYDYTAAYHALARGYLPPAAIDRGSIAWEKGPDPEWSGPADDAALWSKIFSEAPNARAAMAGHATWRQMYDGDAVALGRSYPSATGEPFDWSSADFALLSKLAFYTGRDPARMERMFATSALGQRDKWRDREPYRRDSIEKTIASCDAVYRDHRDAAPGAEAPPSTQLLDPTLQLVLFAGCIYLADRNRILTPLGDFYNEKQFRSMYGGHTFMMDWEGGKTSNAWEALVESRVNPPQRAHGSTFRPLDAPGTLYNEGGRVLVNSYVPQGIESVAGDASPFIDLVCRLISNPRDREIYLSYLAFCVQHLGVKAQWAPVIQGVQGNGKSWVARAVAETIGARYSHFADARDLDNRFNGWLAEKLLIVVEEIRTKHSDEVMEVLKPYITNERIALQPKGVDQVTGDNAANFLFNTNYQDAVRKTRDDRRYCLIFTDQQNVEDLARCGMGGEYFPRLWAWAKSGGWRIIAHYLQHYAIADEFNPAMKCHRAPETSSTAEAIVASQTPDEQRIVEAIAEEDFGFRGGWVSSLQLARLFERERSHPRRLRDAVQRLGYIPHPALKGGRSTKQLPTEGNKRPCLYVLANSIQAGLTVTQVVPAYQKAQTDTSIVVAPPGVTQGI